MDTNKIMEALATIERALQMSRLNNECRGEYYDGWCSQALPLVDQIRAEFDKAQQPGKVLTNEEIERIAECAVPPFAGMSVSHGLRIEHQHEGALIAIRYLSDNGYLAPAAWLTVEEGEQIVKEWCFEWCERVAPDDNDWSDLRARLTAAIEAKRTA